MTAPDLLEGSATHLDGASAASACDGPVPAREWLPQNKIAAVVWTIDDVHPGRSSDAYEAGGDVGKGALGHVEWLLARHPALNVTLFTTADWRQLGARPSRARRLLARVPALGNRMYLAPIRRDGSMRLDRHPAFAAYLRGLPRTDLALHGLHHVHSGPRISVEFQDQDAPTCATILEEALDVFRRAGLRVTLGMTPPGWNLTAGLSDAMVRLGFHYVASARDVVTTPTSGATTAMSGLNGVSLVHPERICCGRLVHFTSNFQATCAVDRALQIVGLGGLLAVKAHIVKQGIGHVQVDGMDLLYRNYLDVVFGTLEDRYGDSLWWTTMGEVARRVRTHAPPDVVLA